MVTRTSNLHVLLAAGGCLALMACVDPVHDSEIQALGPEDPGVGRGPLHRPGQPCLVCHGGNGPSSTTFTVAGTVYAVQGGNQPASRAVVQIEDIDGRIVTIATNAAGNFYLLPTDFIPHYPIQMQVTSADGATVATMLSPSMREGSCASCHTSSRGPTSPGAVYVSPAAVDAGTD
jgi:hypothetical protein